MFLEDFSSEEITNYIDKVLENNKPVTKKDPIFEKWFKLTPDNLTLEYDSIFVIETNYIDSYEDDGSVINGLPLLKLISFEDSENKNSNVCVLDVKIPFSLDINYTHRFDDTQKYCIFYIESKCNLFKSTVSEENVDNSYMAIKELLDGKFNKLRQLNYEDIPFTLSDICTKNSIKNFQMLIYEMLTMALCRDLKNVEKEFRYVTESNKNKYDSFQMINVRDISRNTSAFSALASENISKSILTALRQSKKESSEIITPQEQIALGRYDRV